MGKIKGTEPSPGGASGAVEGEQETKRPSGEELSINERDLLEEGGRRAEGEGGLGSVSKSLELPPPGRGGGTEDDSELREAAGPSIFKRLDDKVDELISGLFDPRFRPGEAIELLKRWESSGPAGGNKALVEIGGLSSLRRYPLLAHLIGVGGTLSVSFKDRMREVPLEGLPVRDSRDFLPPVFALVTRRVRGVLLGQTDEDAAAGLLDEVLRPIEKAWGIEGDLGALENEVWRAASSRPTGRLLCVRAGWRSPEQHAAGLVYAREGEKHMLYACNAGKAGKITRTVEKFEIKDPRRLYSFLNREGGNQNAGRKIWFEDPGAVGLESAPKSEQIPEEFSRAFQKRGSCGMASRKSCQLAMLWSMGLEAGLPPKQIKTLYKMTTTAIRMEGVALALHDGDPEFLPRVLVALLSKWDRPDCRRLAYRVVDGLMEGKGLVPVCDGITDSTSFNELGKAPYIEAIRTALRVCEIDLKAKDSGGLSMLEYAKFHNNTEVIHLLRKLGV